MTTLLEKLSVDFPAYQFVPGDAFFWSSKNNQIQYSPNLLSRREGLWSILHELGHALCDHHDYSSDIELLILEREAWAKARVLAQKYSLVIDENHIEDCMDTYREWLHQRSQCPRCGSHTLQQKSEAYSCYNCKQKWSVTLSRFCRPYRLRKK